MQNSLVGFAFAVLVQKYRFWENFVQKIKIVSLSWDLVLRLIPICRIQWGCSRFLVLILNTFFGHTWSKNLKFFVQSENWYLTNSNMQNSIAVIIASVLDWKYPFWVSAVQKMKTASFSCNLALCLTHIWRTQWCSLFMFLNGSILFMANLFQKTKITCWNWNLDLWLIWICIIRWWFSFFSFLD